MMASHAARTLAHAIRHGARRHAEQHGHRVYRGTIVSLAPLGVDVHGTDLPVLDGTDVELSQDVARYAASEGLKVGDVLALNEVEQGDWVAVTVMSDTAVWPVERPGDPG